MGAHCEIFEFNHDRYCECVVPALQRLLCTGEPGLWLEAVAKACFGRDTNYVLQSARIPNPYNGVPPANAVVASEPMLRFADGSYKWPPIDSQTHLFLDDQLAACPQPTAWVLRYNLDPIHSLQILYQAAVEVSCLGPGRFLGRRLFPETLWWEWIIATNFDETGATPADCLKPLLQKLSQRGKNWTTNSGGFGEGIHGWLCAEEARQLAVALDEVLPYRQTCDPEGADSPGGQPVEDASWDDSWPLAPVRDAAAEAAGRNRGILWGHDVINRSAPGQAGALDPAWRTANVVALARTVEDGCAFELLPILGDALEEAGCRNAVYLAHCREPGDHVCGCWVVDRILSKG